MCVKHFSYGEDAHIPWLDRWSVKLRNLKCESSAASGTGVGNTNVKGMVLLSH